MNKKKSSLHKKMLAMGLVPLVLLGIVITMFSIHVFRKEMRGEVKAGLRSVCITLASVYDKEYPGDFELISDGNKTALRKGSQDVGSIEAAFDAIKAETGIDTTLFYNNMRVLTTIRNAEGKRIAGTVAHSRVTQDVLRNNKEMFYDSVDVNGIEYFAYYMPVYDSNGSTCGMVFAGKPVETVMTAGNSAVNRIILIAILTMLIVGIATIRFTDNMIHVINKIMKFWKEIATGNLSTELDHTVLERNDELGAMGHLTIFVQKSLRFMVEYDTLTQLYNRRTIEMKLEKILAHTESQGGTFSVAIVDIDFFKKVNDTYGHECGDVVLKEVANELGKCMNTRGFAGRWGGEEFLLIFKDRGRDSLGMIFDELFENIRNKVISYDNQEIRVTITAGAVEYDRENNNTILELLKTADMKMYEGKISGRNKYVL